MISFLLSLIPIDEHSLPSLPFFLSLLLLLITAVSTQGFFIVQPNQARVLTFFGRYSASVRQAGFYFTNPLAQRKKIPLRIHNFTSQTIKVNDARGNPIEIGAVIVWQVTDGAKARYAVENY